MYYLRPQGERLRAAARQLRQDKQSRDSRRGVCICFSSHQPRAKKFPEHSQPVERYGMYRKDLDVEGSGSVTSSKSI
jgi:hypothetical protein